MAVPFSNTKLRVPKGFQNILEGLAREILRSQPANPFEFGAKYFDQLLKVREETGHDPAIHGARLEDRFYNNDSFKSPSVDPGSPQQQDAALTIQTNYRKHDAEQKVAAMKEDAAAEKIQAGVRGHEEREKVKEMKETKAEEEEVDIDLNDPEVEAAAMKIQAGFKGFKARQEIKEKKDQSQSAPQPEDTSKEEEIDIDLNDPEVSNAALKIQAGFRGHQSRQKVKDMKEEQNKAEGVEKADEGTAELDMTDPDLSEAALAIQTSFRTHVARKEVEALKDQKEAEVEVDSPADNDPIDIDLNDPEVGQAALKIQAGFRGHKTRKQMKEPKDNNEQNEETNNKPEVDVKENEEVDIDLTDPEVGEAALKIQAGFRGHKARKGLADKDAKKDDPEKMEPPKEEKKEEEVVDIDLKDPEVEDAALKIQAGFKGMKARQEIKAMKDEKQDTDKAEEAKPSEEAADKPSEEAVDIDLNDPETEKAALKIQAGFKGYQTRKEIQSKKEAQKPKEEAPVEATEETKADGDEKVDIDLNDPEVEKAATKIQAGFKGYKTRKDLKDKSDSGDATTEAQGESKTEGEEEAVDIDINDPEVAKAATKIQAGFKGYKTRKEIGQKKSENEAGESKTEGEQEEKTEGVEVKAEGVEEKTEGVEAKTDEKVEVGEEKTEGGEQKTE